MRALTTAIATGLLTVAFIAAHGADTAYVEERSYDLGSGLRRVMVAERCDSPGCFERLMHHEYLFYRDRKLGAFSTVSVAPGGKLILYQDRDSTEMMLYRPADGKLLRITRNLRDVADEYQWSPDLKQVRVFFLNSKRWKTLRIPQTI